MARRVVMTQRERNIAQALTGRGRGKVYLRGVGPREGEVFAYDRWVHVAYADGSVTSFPADVVQFIAWQDVSSDGDGGPVDGG